MWGGFLVPITGGRGEQLAKIKRAGGVHSSNLREVEKGGKISSPNYRR